MNEAELRIEQIRKDINEVRRFLKGSYHDVESNHLPPSTHDDDISDNPELQYYNGLLNGYHMSLILITNLIQKNDLYVSVSNEEVEADTE